MLADFESNVITNLRERSEFTPDYPKLRKKENVLLFVYDDWKQGFTENRFLEKHGKFLGRSRTHSAFYELKEAANGEVILLDSINGPGYVFGEVWAVPPEFIMIYDQIKKNTRLFNRTSRSVILLDQTIPFRSGGKPYAQCQIYIGIKEMWEKVRLTPSTSYFSVDKRGRRSRFFEYEEQKDLYDYYNGHGGWSHADMY